MEGERVVALQPRAARGRRARRRRRARRVGSGGRAAAPRASNATRPQRSPSSSATAATAETASTATSSRVPPASGADISRPESSRQTTSRSCSIRYWFDIGRPSRSVAAQFTCRMSSSGQVVADRLEVRAEPEGSAHAQPALAEAAAAHGVDDATRGRQVGVDVELGVLEEREVAAAEPERAGAPGRRDRGGRAGRGGARRASPRALSSASEGSSSTSGGTGWRRRTAPVTETRWAQLDAAPGRRGRAGARQLAANGGRLPHGAQVDDDRAGERDQAERDDGQRQRERRRARARATASAVRRVGLIAGRGPPRARPPPRPRPCTARAPPPGAGRDGGAGRARAASTTSSGVTKSRPASRASAFAAASR